MTMPVRLRLSRRKGFNLQALSIATNGLPAVKVARRSKWGNPFVVGRDGDAAYCVHLFGAMINGLFALGKCPTIDDQKQQHTAILAELPELRGKNLACWCRPGAPCHADVLLELANPEPGA